MSQSPCTYLTWMFGFALFQASTIDLFAATVGSCQARLWNVSVTVALRCAVAAEAVADAVTAPDCQHRARRCGGACF